jgi:serine/threonine-protein phosphatase Stp1
VTAGRSAPSARFRSWAATHVGAVRRHNEDCVLNRPDLGLWAVADGAGGHQAGEVAAQTICGLLEAIPPDLAGQRMLAEVRRRLQQAHDVLREEAARRGPGALVASTVVVLLARDGHFACLWAGDSRAYLLRGGQFTQLTRDHSLVQQMVDAGSITAAQAVGHPHGNVITRAVGADAEVLDLDKVTGLLLPGDRFLLCSDGLCKTLAEQRLAILLGERNAGAAAERLIVSALDEKATDNVSVVIVEVVMAAEAAEPPPA